MNDPLFSWMEIYFVDYQNPSNEEPGWRRYTIEAMAMEYGTRLSGEPIEHDLKMINEAMRIKPDDYELIRIKQALQALPDEQYTAIFAKYWYQGTFYPGLVFSQHPSKQKWRDGEVGKPRAFEDEDRAKKIGQSLRTFERNVEKARDAIYPKLGLKRGSRKAA